MFLQAEFNETASLCGAQSLDLIGFCSFKSIRIRMLTSALGSRGDFTTTTYSCWLDDSVVERSIPQVLQSYVAVKTYLES